MSDNAENPYCRALFSVRNADLHDSLQIVFTDLSGAEDKLIANSFFLLDYVIQRKTIEEGGTGMFKADPDQTRHLALLMSADPSVQRSRPRLMSCLNPQRMSMNPQRLVMFIYLKLLTQVRRG